VRRPRRKPEEPSPEPLLERSPEQAPDLASIHAITARGGLATTFDDDGTLYHLTPPETATSLRYLVTRLQQAEGAGLPPVFAVTSALAGEGVSFIAASLAAIAANDLGHTVCLVEANWPLPSDDPADHAEDGQGGRPGLADVLSGSCGLTDALRATNDHRLAVLRSGTLPVADRPGAMAGSAFADLLELIRKGFDLVIIDAPPVLQTSEAITIARQAEVAVLVVRHGITTERQVATAIGELAGVDVLGVILNRAETQIPKVLQRFAVPD
jgi:Mrp family chromosome partitioning ATPase